MKMSFKFDTAKKFFRVFECLFMHIVCNVKGLKTEPEVGRDSAGENKFLVPIYALLLLRFCLSFRLYL